MATSTDRYFKVGETVHLRARISTPGTREPVDATVMLASLTLDAAGSSTSMTVSSAAFTRVLEGDYEYVLATHSLAPGTYKIVVRVSDGEDKISLLSDQFVLRVA